jgi:hypothetical protein
MSSRYQHVDGSTYEGEWIADRQWEIPASRTQAKALRGKYDRSAAYSIVSGPWNWYSPWQDMGHEPEAFFSDFHER